MIELLDCLLYKIAGEQLHHDIQYLNDLYRKKKMKEMERNPKMKEIPKSFFVINLDFPFNSKIRDLVVLIKINNSSRCT